MMKFTKNFPQPAIQYACFDAEVVASEELLATWTQDLYQFSKDSQDQFSENSQDSSTNDSSDMPEPDIIPPANYAAAIGCIEQLKYFALEQDMANFLNIWMSGEDVECKIMFLIAIAPTCTCTSNKDCPMSIFGRC